MPQLRLRRQRILLDTVLHHFLKRVERLRLWWCISRRLLTTHGWGKLCSGVYNHHLPDLIRMIGCHHGRVSSTHGLPDQYRWGVAKGCDETGDMADIGSWSMLTCRTPRGL